MVHLPSFTYIFPYKSTIHGSVKGYLKTRGPHGSHGYLSHMVPPTSPVEVIVQIWKALGVTWKKGRPLEGPKKHGGVAQWKHGGVFQSCTPFKVLQEKHVKQKLQEQMQFVFFWWRCWSLNGKFIFWFTPFSYPKTETPNLLVLPLLGGSGTMIVANPNFWSPSWGIRGYHLNHPNHWFKFKYFVDMFGIAYVWYCLVMFDIDGNLVSSSFIKASVFGVHDLGWHTPLVSTSGIAQLKEVRKRNLSSCQLDGRTVRCQEK